MAERSACLSPQEPHACTTLLESPADVSFGMRCSLVSPLPTDLGFSIRRNGPGEYYTEWTALLPSVPRQLECGCDLRRHAGEASRGARIQLPPPLLHASSRPASKMELFMGKFSHHDGHADQRGVGGATAQTRRKRGLKSSYLLYLQGYWMPPDPARATSYRCCHFCLRHEEMNETAAILRGRCSRGSLSPLGIVDELQMSLAHEGLIKM
jgi:hypothetical protein